MRSPLYQMVMLVLSVYVLVTLSVSTFLVSDPEIQKVFQVVDLSICFLFFIDFLYMFFSAKDKWRYMKWGWIDLISSIPMIDPLRWGRVAKIVRIIRILRAFKSFRVIYVSVAKSPFETLTMMTFLVVFFAFSISAGFILEFERGLESPLQNASDALWWASLSILNARSGMISPVSPEGILLTVFLNKIGLLLFAYVNASTIAWLLRNRTMPSVIER